MSGTSADGIDAALVNILPQQITLVDFVTYPLAPELKQQLTNLNLTPQITLKDFSHLHSRLGLAFANAANQLLKKTGYTTSDIHAIGSHGQTIFHSPELMMSLQIGHPAIIAKQTGITTVADFRVDDIALGGQGAPLAPVFHQALFQQQKHPLCLINIGGIANISLLNNNATATGFDTGPGNGLMDEFCQQAFQLNYDPNGEIAAQAEPDNDLLNQLLTHPYFSQAAPKSTGRDVFNQAWWSQHTKPELTPQQILSTLNQLTVETLALELDKLKLPANTNCLICGGGAYNKTLLNRLQRRCPNLIIDTTASLNIDPNAIEAMMCAWLAKQRLELQPIDLRQISGSSRPVILGGIWHS